jgi:hypothetical protein
MLLLNMFTEPDLPYNVKRDALKLSKHLGLDKLFPLVRGSGWMHWESSMEGVLQAGELTELSALTDAAGMSKVRARDAKKIDDGKKKALESFVGELADKPQEHFQFMVDIVAQGMDKMALEEVDALMETIADVEELTGGGETNALSAFGSGGGFKRGKNNNVELTEEQRVLEARKVLKGPRGGGRKAHACPVPFERLIRKICHDVHERLRMYESLRHQGGTAMVVEDDGSGDSLDAAHEALLLDVFGRIVGRWRSDEPADASAADTRKTAAERGYVSSKFA